MTLAVSLLVVGDFALAVGATGDDRDGAGPAAGPAQVVGVVALVGEDVAGPVGAGEQGRRDGDIGDVARREDQREGAADDVGEGVDLGGLAAARGADRLRLRPPFPPKAERWALT